MKVNKTQMFSRATVDKSNGVACHIADTRTIYEDRVTTQRADIEPST